MAEIQKKTELELVAGLFRNTDKNGNVYYTGFYSDDLKSGIWEYFTQTSRWQARCPGTVSFTQNDQPDSTLEAQFETESCFK